MGSPITSWEGAAAYFTGADSSLWSALFLILALVACIGPIVDCAKHEAKAYGKVTNGK